MGDIALQSSSYSLNVHMASSTLTRLSDPSAVIQFNLGSDGATDASGQVIYLYMHRFNFLSDITVHVPLGICHS